MLGIVGLIVLPVVCSTLAIIFGLLARRDIDRDPRLTGATMAVVAVVLGVLGILAGILWFIYLV